MTDAAFNKTPTPFPPLMPAGTSIAPPKPDMVWIAANTFRMGSDKHYPEEAPVHRVTVDGFWIDRTPVTNAQFRLFVNTTARSAPAVGCCFLTEVTPCPATQQCPRRISRCCTT
jgi:formylglycine-generating enzyme required for sulfatase activity